MSLTKVTYSMLSGAPVNVLDYGATADGVTNDAAAFNTAATIAGVNGAVYVPEGVYNVNDVVNILDGQTWLFDGATLKHTDDTKIILRANAKSDWSILGKCILQGTLVSAATTAETGLYITDGKRYRVEGVQTQLFKGKGIWLDGSNAGALRGDRGQFTDCSAYQSTVGVRIDAGAGAEYNTWSNTNISGCVTGMVMAAGNNTVMGGNIVDNGTGVSLLAGSNHCHGMFVGTNINHNNNGNLNAVGVINGHTFVGCHFYGNGSATGFIWLNGCKGITIQGGIIDCWIYNDSGSGSGVNYIADNYFPEGYGVTLNSNNGALNQLYIMRNYTGVGMSVLNDPAAVYLQAARGGTTQTAAGGATVVFNSEIRDNRNAYDPATGIFTAPSSGVYQLSATLLVTGTALAAGFATVVRNGSAFTYAAFSNINAGATNSAASVTVDVVLTAGDTLQITSNAAGTSPVIATDSSRLSISLRS